VSPESASSQLKALVRRAEHVVTEAELTERLKEGRPLRVKLGLDPTAKDVTLGWAVPLRKLRDFQNAGHTAVLIVGDFTARVGDPSGKSETRKQLTKEEVQANAEECVASLMDILSEENLEVRYNSEWLEPLDFGDLLQITSYVTVAQMLERDDFAKRYAEGRPIGLHEFMYPLMQGYDSVAIRADVELGGTDQLFNLLVGRDLQRAFGQPPQIALTMPLLEGLDGVQKMSQSLGNYISIREKPDVMFGQVMSIPDSLAPRYALLATDMDDDEVAAISQAVEKGGPGAGDAKRTVARRIVAIYHGEAAAQEAEAAFDRQFKEHKAPEDVPEATIPTDALDGDRVSLPILLTSLGLTSSRSEARRLISQAGVRVNGATVEEETVPAGGLRGALVQVGKRRFVRLT
jgi:tyrosyl-tRNA synthetase